MTASTHAKNYRNCGIDECMLASSYLKIRNDNKDIRAIQKYRLIINKDEDHIEIHIKLIPHLYLQLG